MPAEPLEGGGLQPESNVRQLKGWKVKPNEGKPDDPPAIPKRGRKPPPGDDPMLGERLARLEGALGGVMHVQTQIFIGLTVVAAFVIGFGVYTLTRIDSLSDRLNEMPNKISVDLRDIAKTLAESITAAKQQPPQVILIPEKNVVPPQTVPPTAANKRP